MAHSTACVNELDFCGPLFVAARPCRAGAPAHSPVAGRASGAVGAALIRRHKDYSAENELRIEGPGSDQPCSRSA